MHDPSLQSHAEDRLQYALDGALLHLEECALYLAAAAMQAEMAGRPDTAAAIRRHIQHHVRPLRAVIERIGPPTLPGP